MHNEHLKNSQHLQIFVSQANHCNSIKIHVVQCYRIQPLDLNSDDVGGCGPPLKSAREINMNMNHMGELKHFYFVWADAQLAKSGQRNFQSTFCQPIVSQCIGDAVNWEYF